MSALIDRTGQRYGRLVVLTRAGSASGRATWLCQCDCGGQAVVNSLNLSNGNTRSCGCLHIAVLKAQQRKGAFRVEAPGYEGAHWRVRRAYGKASEYYCVGCMGDAEDWAYDHEDPDELVEVRDGSRLRYSADPDRYQPMCKPCHAVFDQAAKEAMR